MEDTSTSPLPVFARSPASIGPSRRSPDPEFTSAGASARSALMSPVPVVTSSRPAAPVTATSADPVLLITCDPAGARTTTDNGTARSGSALEDCTFNRDPTRSIRASRTASAGPTAGLGPPFPNWSLTQLNNPLNPAVHDSPADGSYRTSTCTPG